VCNCTLLHKIVLKLLIFLLECCYFYFELFGLSVQFGLTVLDGLLLHPAVYGTLEDVLYCTLLVEDLLVLGSEELTEGGNAG
jgi:hypothetical protein